MKGIEQIKTEDREQWLEVRRTGIGGSDAAAVVGLNPWRSPYTLWLDKMGRLPEKEITEAIRQGTDLEEYVVDRFCEQTGKKVQRKNRVLRNEKYPFALANVDRWIVGENAGLECKTTSTLDYKKFKDGEFPATYYLQCMHYMAVTGADKYYLAILVFGKEFIVIEIERDEELIEDLMKSEEQFWNEYVLKKIPPPVDGLVDTDTALQIHYSDPENWEPVDLFGMNGKLDDLVELKERKKDLEREIREIEQELKERLGENVKGQTDGYEVSWKPQTRRSFEFDRFRAEHPDINLDEYYKSKETRVFRIKQIV